jgi:hypothetical protein
MMITHLYNSVNYDLQNLVPSEELCVMLIYYGKIMFKFCTRIGMLRLFYT